MEAQTYHFLPVFKTSSLGLYLAVSENDDSMGTRMCSEYSDDDGSKILNGDVEVIEILELSIK